MKLKDKDLALILIVLGIAFVLLPKISRFLPDHPAESGRMVGDESGGGYFPSSGYDIPWNLLQQTPDTGFVGMDPPSPDPHPGPGPEPDPEPGLAGGSFWDAIRDGLGFAAGYEIVRRTIRDLDGLKKVPPRGGTPTPAPAGKPTPGPVGIKLPEFDPAYAKDAAGLGAAAGLTVMLAKLTGAGSTLAARTPTAAGGMLFTPEMFGAPAGTTRRNINMFVDRLSAGAQQISQGRVVQGFSTALGATQSSDGRKRHTYSHGVYDRPMKREVVAPGKVLISADNSTRTERISQVDYS